MTGPAVMVIFFMTDPAVLVVGTEVLFPGILEIYEI